MGKRTDTLYQAPRRSIADFDFGEEVVGVFDDMLARSVPFYDEIQRMVVDLAGVFIQGGTTVYDLGCSTGTTLVQLMRQFGQHNDVAFVGVDNSAPMLKRARQKLRRAGYVDRCDLRLVDVDEMTVEHASVVIMILTLQFVRPLSREHLMRRLYQGLVANGCLLLVEKVLCRDPGFNGIFTTRYHGFKQRHRYSKLEIAQKREALEHVLIPYHMDEHHALLERSGFSAIEMFFRWYNFAGLVAVKGPEIGNASGVSSRPLASKASIR